MPLVALAYLATVAGLTAGLTLPRGAAPVVVGGGALLLGVAALVRRRHAAGGLLLVLAAALGIARVHREREAACRARVAASPAWRVILADAVRPGARSRGRWVDAPRCALDVSIGVAHGSAPAGALVLVAGEALPAGGSVALRIVGARVRELPGGSRRLRLHARVRATVDALYGDRAPLVAALTIADDDDLDRAVRDRYADAGLVHALSVSGLHVGILAVAIELLAGLLRCSRRVGRIAGAVGAAIYVLFLGLPAPALRAGAMLAAVAASRLLQRPTSPWAVLALGAAAPLLADAGAIARPGYQLSVAGVAALVACGTLLRRRLPRHWPRPVRVVAASLAASTAATLVTAPLVAWHFGRLSLAAPLTNLAAAPVVAVLQPTLFLSLALAPLGAPARLVADAARPMLAALDAVASAGAALPMAAVSVGPTLGTALCCGAAVAALLVAMAAHFPMRALLAAAASLAVAVWAPLAAPGPGRMELHVIDVGQGDALALRSPRGRWVVVDAGRIWSGGDAGRRTVLPYLRRRGGAVVAFVLSHPHADHVGGAASLLAATHPREFWDPGYAEPTSVYRHTLDEAARDGVRWQRVHPGDSLLVDGLVITALAPDSAWAASLRDANSASTVLLARYGAVRFLLTGDAEAPEEALLVGRLGAALHADVLKVAHHGSSTSTTPAFLAAVRPRVAVVSVGAGNMYGHPSPDVMARLLAAGAQVLRTDQLGSVVVWTDGEELGVDAAGERWRLRAPSRP
ncbi:MAG TPA: DNA internalization-related competence protein ComEC/Rec2 [Gemmatimonadaceae bacterium]|nr:DNA internalization-related competence protein ComEC/Rec2 [Gemmatimonadaceae bacterium]